MLRHGMARSGPARRGRARVDLSQQVRKELSGLGLVRSGEHWKGALTAYVQCTPDSDPDGRAYANDCILFCEASFLPGAHIVFGRDAGGGTIAACIKDSGQGSAAPDEAVVVVRGNGPAQPFRRSNATVLGNFVVHP